MNPPSFSADLPTDRSLEERPLWKNIRGVWRPLHGNFFVQGCSLEWHDFQTAEDLDWSRSFHEGSLEICLNFSGHAILDEKNVTSALGPGQLAIYTAGPGAKRLSGSLHKFLTIELSTAYFQKQLRPFLDQLLPDVRDFASGNPRSWQRISSLPACLQQMRLSLLRPPVYPGAYDLWYQSKIREIVAQTLFRAEMQEELFCHKQARINRERIEQVMYFLERDYENPPSLEMLAQEVDCSPFHLSRLFAKQAGMSIPKYLRTKRIEKAAALLKEGRFNVSEVAATVGYASLSAFTKAFVEQIGCCPGLYAHLKPEAILEATKRRQFGAPPPQPEGSQPEKTSVS